MGSQIVLGLWALLLCSTAAFAVPGPQNIKPTVHNLSTSGPQDRFYASDPGAALKEDQICIYCHTPHGGSIDAPLWSKDMSAMQGVSIFKSYTTVNIPDPDRAIQNESLVCLTCHDGSIGIAENMITSSGVLPDNAFIQITALGTTPDARIGATIANPWDVKQLTDDHPISFSYKTIAEANTADFHTVAEVETAGLSLYGTNEFMECATCHDPHVNYLDFALYGGDPEYAPFLAIPNKNSEMCLTCHVK